MDSHLGGDGKITIEEDSMQESAVGGRSSLNVMLDNNNNNITFSSIKNNVFISFSGECKKKPVKEPWHNARALLPVSLFFCHFFV